MSKSHRILGAILLGGLLLSACFTTEPGASASLPATQAPTVENTPTALPTREKFAPGQLVDYIAQSGDTLPALAAHFNTTETEIRTANPSIPDPVTTLPPGFPMKIPIYYESLWGAPVHILPDNAFVNGPAEKDFSLVQFVNAQPGWLKTYTDYVVGVTRDGAGIIDYVSKNYSISAKLLLILVEYQTHALSDPTPLETESPMGFHDPYQTTLYAQLILTANALNNGYYGWRTGRLKSFSHADGTLEFPDPWQNAGTVGVQYFFTQTLNTSSYQQATVGGSFLKLYTHYFGDPWQNIEPQIPGSLKQPALVLPFTPGTTWVVTGGPHSGWGSGDPLAALDFAPPLEAKGCWLTELYALAVADGVIVRTGIGVAVLDLDGDGDEHTGWDILYLHLTTSDIPPVGTHLKKGDRIGRPSCEGGETTGTHVHIARKYNGEWIAADSALPFNMEGWIPHNGDTPYLGTLTRAGHVVVACTCSDYKSFITAGLP
jgi:LasA protease